MAQNTAEKNSNLKSTIQSVIIHSNDILSGTNVQLKRVNVKIHTYTSAHKYKYTHTYSKNLLHTFTLTPTDV